jgi:hypothetical protein
MVVRNSNAPEGWITTFKDIGKFIAIYDELVAGNLGVQSKTVEAVEQQDYDYGTVKSLSTFINNMVSASTNLDTAKTNLVSANTNYLTQVTANDINSTATTASGVIADMIQGMTGASTGAAISGLQVLSGGHFHTFFADEYGITMPVTSGSIYVSQAESMNMISGTLPSLRRQIDDSYGD